MLVERSGRQVIGTQRGLSHRPQMLSDDFLSPWINRRWNSVHEFQYDLLNTHKDAKSHIPKRNKSKYDNVLICYL